MVETMVAVLVVALGVLFAVDTGRRAEGRADPVPVRARRSHRR
jgi:hypothetical protein